MNDHPQGEKDHGEGHGHGKEITVIVNGREKRVTKGELSFDEVVALADGLPTGPNVLYTITYRKGDGHKPEGSLVQGGTVKVKNGTIFNVSPTDKS